MGALLFRFALAETQSAEMSQFHALQFFFIFQQTFAYSSVLSQHFPLEQNERTEGAGPAHMQFRSVSIL